MYTGKAAMSQVEKLVELGAVVTLKEHFEALLAEKDKALIAALVAVKEENRKTEAGAEKRFDLLNELRDGVATKEQLEAVEKVVNDLRDRINATDGQSKGSEITIGKIYAAIAAAVGIIGTVILLANGVFK